MVATLVAALRGERSRLILHSIRPRARGYWADSLPAAGLARAGRGPGRRVNRRRRNIGLLSPVAVSPIFAAE